MASEPLPGERCPTIMARASPACRVVTVGHGEHVAGSAGPPTGVALGQAVCPACGDTRAETAIVWGREVRGALPGPCCP